MPRTSVNASRGHNRGVQATKDVKRKWKREAVTADEPSQAVSMATSRWSPSIASDGEVRRLIADGSFPPALRYRISLSRETPPAPLPDEHVLHFNFFSRGLDFPLHPFVRGLLFFYGCQLHHLSPTGILHLPTLSRFASAIWEPPPTWTCFATYSTLGRR